MTASPCSSDEVHGHPAGNGIWFLHVPALFKVICLFSQWKIHQKWGIYIIIFTYFYFFWDPLSKSKMFLLPTGMYIVRSIKLDSRASVVQTDSMDIDIRARSTYPITAEAFLNGCEW